MPKKCMMCENEAEYCIKGCPESYCKECAVEQFQDVDYLQKIEELEIKRKLILVDDAIEEGASESEESRSEE